MKPHVVGIYATAVGLLLAGCATTPSAGPAAPPPRTAPPKTAAVQPAPAAPAAVPAAVQEKPAAPEAKAEIAVSGEIPPPPISPETQALVERLTNPEDNVTTQHQIADRTGFPEAMRTLQPGAKAPVAERFDMSGQPPTRGLTADGSTVALVEKDWTGLVLVPVSAQLSKAYTSAVRLAAVEAHPLNDGRVRVWARIRNTDGAPLTVEVACPFATQQAGEPGSPRFYQLAIPGGSFRDVFFVSPLGSVVAYKVLVRTEAMAR